MSATRTSLDPAARPLPAQVQNRPQTSPNRPTEQHQDRRTRERLIVQNMPLVSQIARRIHARLPRSVMLEDLVHEGHVGLIEAIDRYEDYRGVPLRLFARQRITGSILDMLRRLDWVPRTVRRRADTLTDTRDRLWRRLGRKPDASEMASALGLGAEAYDQMVRTAEIRKLLSLDAPANAENNTPLIETLAADNDPSESRSNDELRAAVIDAVERLPAKERAAVKGFYLEGRALVEVGAEIGVSESRTSQLHRMGVERLRHKVREHLGD